MNFLFDLIYPPKCPLCDELRENRNICERCVSSVHFLEADFTGLHFERVWFDQARSCFAYEGKIAQAIHGLKYSMRFDLVRFFAEYLAEEAFAMADYDVVLPVPFHWSRFWKRGYNPAALLAKAVAKKMVAKSELKTLVKKKNTRPQVGLSRKERLENIKGAFDVNLKDGIAGKKVLLIDDVLTTGATINECAKTLIRKGGSSSVDVLTIARTI